MGNWRGISGSENCVQESVRIAEIGDDDIRADGKEAIALPLIDFSGAVVRFIAGDGDSQATDLFGVLDFDVTIAEGEELIAGDLVFTKNSVDNHFFGKGFVIVLSAVNVGTEKLGETEQLGFALDERFVGAAGEIKAHAAASQGFKQGARAEHE